MPARQQWKPCVFLITRRHGVDQSYQSNGRLKKIMLALSLNKKYLPTYITNTINISYNRFMRDKYHVHYRKTLDFSSVLFLLVDNIEALR